MGLFETPIILGIVAALLTLFVFLRWRGRHRDEWRKESAAPPQQGVDTRGRP